VRSNFELHESELGKIAPERRIAKSER